MDGIRLQMASEIIPLKGLKSLDFNHEKLLSPKNESFSHPLEKRRNQRLETVLERENMLVPRESRRVFKLRQLLF